MKYGTLAIGFALGVVAAVGAGAAFSQDHKPAPPPKASAGAAAGDRANAAAAMKMPTPEQMQEGMKKWMEVMTPGEAHQHLMKSVGTWDTVTRLWEGGPDAPPTEVKGTTTMKAVLGNRFIMQEHKSQMSMPNEKGEMQMIPWDGLGLFGYDNYQKMYVGCWCDSMGTQMLTMKGNVSPDGKTMTMYGQMDEPMLGVIGRYNKYVTRIIDDNTQKFEVYDLAAGENYKAVEVTYTRKK